MNNEIKEILDFKENADYKKLSCDEIKVLKDYITNLQEQLHKASLDIQELIERDIECPSWCDKLTNLQQENKKLERKNEKWFRVAKDFEMEANDLWWKNDELKSRIEKAIEYIKVECMCNYGLDDTYMEKLLNILKGEDNE